MIFSNDRPSFPLACRPPAGRAAVSVSRCFQTDGEGRIPLTGDWPRLLGEARARLPRAALQTRHAYARMIAMVPVPEFIRRPENGWMSDVEGALHFNGDAWAAACARVAHCACCGSPGRVEIFNAHDLDCVQICALPDCEPSAWGAFVESVLPEKDVSHASDPVCPPADADVFMVPDEARPIRGDSEAFMAFLRALGDAEAFVSWTIRTEEFLHTRTFPPRHVREEDGVLSVGSGGLSVQVCLPAVRALVVDPRLASAPLYLTGPGDSILLALAPAPGREPAAGWRAALRAAFPHHD